MYDLMTEMYDSGRIFLYFVALLQRNSYFHRFKIFNFSFTVLTSTEFMSASAALPVIHTNAVLTHVHTSVVVVVVSNLICLYEWIWELVN